MCLLEKASQVTISETTLAVLCYEEALDNSSFWISSKEAFGFVLLVDAQENFGLVVVCAVAPVKIGAPIGATVAAGLVIGGCAAPVGSFWCVTPLPIGEMRKGFKRSPLGTPSLATHEGIP